MGRFSKFGQNWLKFKKILEKIGTFVQNLAQNWADWYMNRLLFLEKLVFVWVYFQIPWWHIPTKPNLSTPPDLDLVIMQVPVSHSVQRGLKPTLFIFIPPFISNHTFYKNKHTHPFADHVFQK